MPVYFFEKSPHISHAVYIQICDALPKNITVGVINFVATVADLPRCLVKKNRKGEKHSKVIFRKEM